ncbi:hypothetical protein ABBQ38_002215 [Trebouxia sp. C0009 RCD-2024]
MSGTGAKRYAGSSAGSGHCSALPDELLSHVLRLLPFATKAAAHSVSKRWNRVLRHPVIANLWEDCELDLTATALTAEREEELWIIAQWLARRAYGIPRLLVSSGSWHDSASGYITESGSFYKEQFPYLLGQLRYRKVDLKLSFCSTDSDLLPTSLLSESPMKSYLRDNLIDLYLMKYHDGNTAAHESLDTLSNLTSLQTLHIRPLHMGETWEVTSNLSQLMSLRTFQFQRGVLTGSLVAALGSLPALTELKSSCIPGYNFTVGHSQFTSLRSFTKSSNALYDSERTYFVLQLPQLPLHAMLTAGQTLGMLRKLSLHDCIFDHQHSAPRLQFLACLKKVKFKNCRFRPELWLEDALQGASQIERMKIVECRLKVVPKHLSQLVRLRTLTLADNYLNTLPPDFTDLTALEFLGLYHNMYTSVPEVLEQMVHLKEISLAYSGARMCVTRSLTFLLEFQSLLAFNIAQEVQGWDSTSLFYIGEFVAAMDGTVPGMSRRKPQFLW